MKEVRPGRYIPTVFKLITSHSDTGNNNVTSVRMQSLAFDSTLTSSACTSVVIRLPCVWSSIGRTAAWARSPLTRPAVGAVRQVCKLVSFRGVYLPPFFVHVAEASSGFGARFSPQRTHSACSTRTASHAAGGSMLRWIKR